MAHKVTDRRESLLLKISYTKTDGSYGVATCNTNYNLEPCGFTEKHKYHLPAVLLVSRIVSYLVEYDQEKKIFKIFKKMSGSFYHYYDTPAFPELQEAGKELPVLCGLHTSFLNAVFSVCDKKNLKRVTSIASISEVAMHSRNKFSYYSADEKPEEVVGIISTGSLVVHNWTTGGITIFK